jgi:hypothetical protein
LSESMISCFKFQAHLKAMSGYVVGSIIQLK